MDKYIFSYVDEDRDGIFRDLTSVEAANIIDFLPSHKRYHNHVVATIEKAALNYKLNSKFKVPFQGVFYNLDSYQYNVDDRYHMIIPTTSISKFSTNYLEAFKKRHSNVNLYALVTDSMHAQSPHMNLVREKLFSKVWTEVLTYDKYDAEEYGFKWFGYTYYSSFDFVKPDSLSSDIYYVGYDKGGRNRIVLDVYNKILSEGGQPRFDVVSKKKRSDNSFIYLKKKISYPEVVSRLKSANCILEVLQDNQRAQSLRYFEAVVYNKKLLTFNQYAKDLPYYNPNYMRIITNVSEIDINWVKKREKIDYGYSGNFSPIGIIGFIRRYINE